jgi:hypothetical protein
MKRALLLALLAGCGKASAAEPLHLPALAEFEYRQKEPVPEHIAKWSGRRVRTTGFMNPTTQARDLTTFLLVKDRGSCCFGKQPQTNHYIEVKLRPGRTTHYTTDPVTVEGVLTVEERWDGDWPLGLYWMDDAEVAK